MLPIRKDHKGLIKANCIELTWNLHCTSSNKRLHASGQCSVFSCMLSRLSRRPNHIEMCSLKVVQDGLRKREHIWIFYLPNYLWSWCETFITQSPLSRCLASGHNAAMLFSHLSWVSLRFLWQTLSGLQRMESKKEMKLNHV